MKSRLLLWLVALIWQEVQAQPLNTFSQKTRNQTQLYNVLNIPKTTDWYAYTLKDRTQIYNDKGETADTIPAGISFRTSQILQEKNWLVQIKCKNTVWWIFKSAMMLYDQLDSLTEKVIIIDRAKRTMHIYDSYGEHSVKELPIALWSTDSIPHDKTRQWDYNTPEGKYYICSKNPLSNYWEDPTTKGKIWSLMISYPNIQDAWEWVQDKAISTKSYDVISKQISQKWTPSQTTKLWWNIMIHWWWVWEDRTWGCIAIDNDAMKRLYDFVQTGADVIIY